MKNAFARMSRMCVSLAIGGGLVAGALLAASGGQIRVTLPHQVAAGSVTLPPGDYTMSSYEMGGEDYFLVRGEKGALVVLPAQAESNDSASKTQLTFSKDGDVWHFEKLSIAGAGSYQFTGVK